MGIQQIEHLKGADLHHAYIIESTHEDASLMCTSHVCSILSVEMDGNPDVVRQTYQVFGIDDARALQEAQFNRAFGGGKKIFVLQAQMITTQAQNALLKIFEEPTEGTHFFLLLPSARTLLPTLLSRCSVLSLEDEKKERAKKFLELSLAERLSFVLPIYSEKNISDIENLTSDLEIHIHELWKKDREEKWKNALLELEMVRSYIGEQGASYKFLLEHLALVLPQI